MIFTFLLFTKYIPQYITLEDSLGMLEKKKAKGIRSRNKSLIQPIGTSICLLTSPTQYLAHILVINKSNQLDS